MGLGGTGLNRRLAEISFSSAIYNVGFYLGTSLMILYLVGLGYSPFLAGVLLAVSKLLYSVAMMTTGALSDRMGRKIPIVWGFAMTGAALVAMGLLTNMAADSILLLVVWVGYAFQGPAASAAVSDVAFVGKTAIGFGWFYMLLSGGQVIGQALAGATAQAYGYPATLIGGGVLSLVAVALINRYVDQRPKKEEAHLDFMGDLRHGLGLVRSDDRLANLIAGISLHTLGFQMFYTYIPLVAALDQGLSDTSIGFLLAVFSGGAALSVFAFGVVTARVGGLRMLVWHLALSSLVWWIYPYLSGYGSLVALMAVMGIIGAMDMPARRELLSYISEGEVGTAMGALDSISMTIGSMGVLAAGALWNQGHWVPFVVSAVVNAVGIIFLLRVRMRSRPA